MAAEQDAGSIVYTVSADVEPLLIGQKQVNELVRGTGLYNQNTFESMSGLVWTSAPAS